MFLGLTFIADEIDLERATLPAHVGLSVLVAEDVQMDALDPDAMFRFADEPAFRDRLLGGYRSRLGTVDSHLKDLGTVSIAQRLGEDERQKRNHTEASPYRALPQLTVPYSGMQAQPSGPGVFVHDENMLVPIVDDVTRRHVFRQFCTRDLVGLERSWFQVGIEARTRHYIRLEQPLLTV